MTDPTYNVLFLCTGNSARSIMAEALLNHWGKSRFRALSAGSHPKGTVHPLALELLKSCGLPTAGLRSKSWDEFAQPGAPSLDFVITVCDSAAGEICPYWTGHPVTAHWGIEDPAAMAGSEAEKRRAFRRAYMMLESRIQLFISLPVATLDRIRLHEHVAAIGKISAPAARYAQP